MHPSFECLHGRRPVAGRDYSQSDAQCQDDHDFLAGEGQYGFCNVYLSGGFIVFRAAPDKARIYVDMHDLENINLALSTFEGEDIILAEDAKQYLESLGYTITE